jgi:glycosyltransferase involved in cell wall biosynthesis
MRELGGARVFVELGAELERQGHVVDHVAATEAHVRPRVSPIQFFRPRFSRLVREQVAAVASRYDVVDALEGDLPFAKDDLAFSGLLVARSVGLSLAFKEFLDFSGWRWPEQDTGHPLGQMLRVVKDRRGWPLHERSWRLADLVNLPNPDELRFLPAEVQDKAVVLPYGLTPPRLADLRKRASTPGRRLRGQEVVFIGYWYPRKGSLDFGRIVRRVRALVPDARFLFLGTSFSEARVLREMDLPPVDWIRVVPAYKDEELPGLLADAAVGIFPSYVEGFPFAVLEQLAARIPTVSYDAAGAREILGGFQPPLLVPRGDVRTLAERVAATLSMPEAEYRSLGEACTDAASRFSWEETARRTAEIYAERLTTLDRAA